jgi:hypothetical protein
MAERGGRGDPESIDQIWSLVWMPITCGILENRRSELENGSRSRDILTVEATPEELDRIQQAGDHDFAVGSQACSAPRVSCRKFARPFVGSKQAPLESVRTVKKTSIPNA